MLILTARPKISEVMQDTKILLQQSRERLVISYVLLAWEGPTALTRMCDPQPSGQ